MIDWVVVVTALTLVPLVALFAFVGCQVLFPVADAPEQAPITFALSDNLDSSVESVEVTISWIEGVIFEGQIEAPTTANGGEPSVTFTLEPPSLPITILDLPVTTASVGVVACLCTITVAGSTVVLETTHQKWPALPVLPFVLASDGSDFTLT